MPNGQTVDERIARQGSIRPLVLLSIDDDDLRAKFAYELTGSGFDVTVIPVVSARRPIAGRRPDVIVAALNSQSGIDSLSSRTLVGDPGARGVPVVAIAPDLSEVMCDVARREGCVAICLTTCTGAALAIGLRAVLEPIDAFSRTTTQTFG
jgi:hypothetical protein